MREVVSHLLCFHKSRLVVRRFLRIQYILYNPLQAVLFYCDLTRSTRCPNYTPNHTVCMTNDMASYPMLADARVRRNGTTTTGAAPAATATNTNADVAHTIFSKKKQVHGNHLCESTTPKPLSRFNSLTLRLSLLGIGRGFQFLLRLFALLFQLIP